jgi:hypothetical protein
MSFRIAACLLLLGACSARPVEDDFRSRLLATIPEGVNVLVPPAFGADGRSVCYVARSEGSDRIVRGGRAGPPWELV